MHPTMHGKNPALLRRINAATTTRLLYESGPMTLTEVVGETGLSRRTAEAVLDSLVESGLVQRSHPEVRARPVGRPARTFRFRVEAGLCMGLEVRRAGVDALLTNLAGEALATARVDVPPRADRAQRVAAIIDCARTVLARGRVPRKDLRAVAVGTPGLVLGDGTVSVCNTLPGWSAFNLREELESWMRCPVLIENDVNLSACGEQWRGAAGGLDSLVWVLAGRRSRAAIILEGRLHRGADGAAGEIGWLPVLGWSEVRDQSKIFATAATGDEAAVEGLARALARGLAALVLTVNPRCLILGGVCAGAGDDFIDVLRRQLEPLCLTLPEIRTSTLGEDCVSLGAVRIALDEVEQQLFSVH